MDREKFNVDNMPTHKIDCAKVEAGHLMAIVQYVNVERAYAGGTVVDLRDLDTGLTWTRSGRELVERMTSADQYAETVAVTRTEMAEILLASRNVPLTVAFVSDKAKKEAAAAGKKEKDAEVRVLKGRLVSHEAVLGRSYVEDLEKPCGGRPGERLRLVDHRELRWLVVGGVRYELK